MKKAIVIGASSGIGEQIALQLVKKGYKVGITARREKNLEALKAQKPESFIVRAFDCSSAINSEELQALTGDLGGLDLLVMSSGIGDMNRDLDLDVERKTLALNVDAFTEIATWSYNFFEKQGAGHFINLSSIAGIRGSKRSPAYNASKAFQIAYVEGLRQKCFKSKTLFVTDIRPGFVKTDILKGNNQFWMATKEHAGAEIMKAIEKKKEIAYITKRWVLAAAYLTFIPSSIYNKM
jgi:short-subunit dehydrogenase